jgi:hypothetical protein
MMMYYPIPQQHSGHHGHGHRLGRRHRDRKMEPKSTDRDMDVLRAILGLATDARDDHWDQHHHQHCTSRAGDCHRQYRHGYGGALEPTTQEYEEEYEEEKNPWYNHLEDAYAHRHPSHRHLVGRSQREHHDERHGYYRQRDLTREMEAAVARAKAEAKAEARDEIRIAVEAAARAERRAKDMERALIQKGQRVDAALGKIRRREEMLANAVHTLEGREKAVVAREQSIARAEAERQEDVLRSGAAAKIQRKWRVYKATRPDVVLVKGLALIARLSTELDALLASESTDPKAKTEGLIRQLETCDSIVSNGNAEIRRRRKAHVRAIMRALEAIDSADDDSEDSHDSAGDVSEEEQQQEVPVPEGETESSDIGGAEVAVGTEEEEQQEDTGSVVVEPTPEDADDTLEVDEETVTVHLDATQDRNDENDDDSDDSVAMVEALELDADVVQLESLDSEVDLESESDPQSSETNDGFVVVEQ